MLYIVLATLFWATSFPVIDHGISYISPLLFGFLRFAVASLLFALYLMLAGRRVGWRDVVTSPLLIYLALLNGSGYILQFQAQALTTASKTALFINTSPIFVALIERFVYKRRIHPYKVIALILVLSGVFLISTNLSLKDMSSINPGDFMNLGAALIWALFVVGSRRAVERFGEETFNMALYLWAAVLLLPFSFLQEVRFHPAGMIHVVHLALFCTIIAYMLYSRAVRFVSPTTVAITFTLEVVLATIISFLWLGERFTPVEGAGALLVLSGITVAGLSEGMNHRSAGEDGAV